MRLHDIAPTSPLQPRDSTRSTWSFDYCPVVVGAKLRGYLVSAFTQYSKNRQQGL